MNSSELQQTDNILLYARACLCWGRAPTSEKKHFLVGCNYHAGCCVEYPNNIIWPLTKCKLSYLSIVLLNGVTVPWSSPSLYIHKSDQIPEGIGQAMVSYLMWDFKWCTHSYWYAVAYMYSTYNNCFSPHLKLFLAFKQCSYYLHCSSALFQYTYNPEFILYECYEHGSKKGGTRGPFPQWKCNCTCT